MAEIQSYRTTVDGITFVFRGTEENEQGEPIGELIDIELIVPPLNLDALKALQSRLMTMGDGTIADSMETLVVALSRALARNYRNVPQWLIRQTVDVANMADMMKALMDVSGLLRKEIDAAKKAVTASGPATIGETSTPIS